MAEICDSILCFCFIFSTGSVIMQSNAAYIEVAHYMSNIMREENFRYAVTCQFDRKTNVSITEGYNVQTGTVP